MTNSPDIFATARHRAQIGQFPYAGAVTPQEAFVLLQNDLAIKLVDVRTKAERDWVGQVNIDCTQHLAVQWQLYPEGTLNPHFLAQLAAVTDQHATLLFLCRSGVRSRQAAKLASENGYSACYDIVEGFEGNKDGAGHRKTIDGWCQAGLAWIGA